LKINKGVDDGLILISTFPNEESLIELSKTLIKDKKLCACVNYTRINSLYMWKNDLKQESEFLALYKTTSKCVEQVKTEILNKQPYEIPEVVILSMKDVSHDYLTWLIDNTNWNNGET
jgi:periplasmic divalent cation tolerance protein